MTSRGLRSLVVFLGAFLPPLAAIWGFTTRLPMRWKVGMLVEQLAYSVVAHYVLLVVVFSYSFRGNGCQGSYSDYCPPVEGVSDFYKYAAIGLVLFAANLASVISVVARADRSAHPTHV